MKIDAEQRFKNAVYNLIATRIHPTPEKRPQRRFRLQTAGSLPQRVSLP